MLGCKRAVEAVIAPKKGFLWRRKIKKRVRKKFKSRGKCRCRSISSGMRKRTRWTWNAASWIRPPWLPVPSNASGKIWETFPIPAKNLPHDSGDLLGTSGLAVPFLSGGDRVRLSCGRIPDSAQPSARGPQTWKIGGRGGPRGRFPAHCGMPSPLFF